MDKNILNVKTGYLPMQCSCGFDRYQFRHEPYEGKDYFVCPSCRSSFIEATEKLTKLVNTPASEFVESALEPK